MEYSETKASFNEGNDTQSFSPAIRTSTACIKEGDLIYDRWMITKKLGNGSYGDVFEALNIETNTLVAIKFENEEVSQKCLGRENKLYKVLWNEKTEVIGFAMPHFYGKHGKRQFLVIDRLGISLQTALISRKEMTKNFVFVVGWQALHRLQHLHERNFLHRDVKPGNFVLGRKDRGLNDSRLLYLIDFGASKRFRENRLMTHIPEESCKTPCGTRLFMSINTHFGKEQSRRDDLESLGYMLVYLLTQGSLPWERLCLADGSHTEIGVWKKSTSPEQLCLGLPIQICQYIKYVRNLSFTECPDYHALRENFLEALKMT